MSCVVSTICTVHLTLCSYHVTYAFQSEFEWLWVRVQLQSLKLKISPLLRARGCGFTLKRVRDMIVSYKHDFVVLKEFASI